MRRGTVAVGLGLVVLWAAVTNGYQPYPGTPGPMPVQRFPEELHTPKHINDVDDTPQWFGIVVAASDDGWYGVESCSSHRSQLVMKGKPGYEVGSAVFFNARKEIVCGGKLLKRIRYFGTPNSVQYNVNDTIEDLFNTPPGPSDATPPGST